MKCPECIKQGLKSIVAIKEVNKTLNNYLPFYDEEGNYHNHDYNYTYSNMECNNGHLFLTVSNNNKCPADICDFNKEEK